MSISSEDKKLLKSSLPAVEESREKLGAAVYNQVKSNPKLQSIANDGQVEDGSRVQDLVDALIVYVKYIEQPEKYRELATIIEKHVIYEVQPEYFTIVADKLPNTFKEVLGNEVATSATVTAWTNAYGELVKLLKEAESKEYDRIEKSKGGWKGFRKFVVKETQPTASNIVAVTFEPEDGQVVLPSKPGQYLTFRTTIDGKEYRRSYSIASGPSEKSYQIAVKKIGIFSGYVHSLKEGDIVEVRPPLGHFVLSEEDLKKPLVFIAAGIGITPLAGMLRSGAQGKLLYYAHNDSERALLNELKSLKNLEYVQTGGSRPNVEELTKYVPKDAIVLYTGPRGFMVGLRGMLREIGIPDENSRYEIFGAGQNLDAPK